MTYWPSDGLCSYYQEKIGELERREHAEKTEKKRLVERCAAERGEDMRRVQVVCVPDLLPSTVLSCAM